MVGIPHIMQCVRESLILVGLGSSSGTSGSPDLSFTAFSLNKQQKSQLSLKGKVSNSSRGNTQNQGCGEAFTELFALENTSKPI